MDAPAPVAEPARPLPLPAPPYSLRVRGLRFSYPGAARRALDGVDLDLRPGRRVAVVGPSGAGKSTLAGVLLRFLAYEARVGRRSTAWRSPISTATSAGAWSGWSRRTRTSSTARSRRTCGWRRREASDEELRAALAAVRLLDWAEQLPGRA